MPGPRGMTSYKRDAMGLGLAVLNWVASSPALDRLRLRRPAERAVYEATKTGYRTAGAVGRTFARVSATGSPARLPASPSGGQFDLTPTEDQQLILAVVREFADEVLAPAAAEADSACTTAEKVLAQSQDLGLNLLELPEDLGGLVERRATTTSVLVAEGLARGDMGQAVACLAPGSVATALALWGDATQQQTYLPAFTADEPFAAALAIAEPSTLFDPFRLSTKAVRDGDDLVLSGVKSAVVRGADADLFVLAADLDGPGPALLLVESGSPGLTVEADPSMGVRAASLARLHLDRVRVPGSALIGAGDPRAYAECVRLSRLAWSALALGTAQAVLDYVVPYVKERRAFGEPIAYRQSVAFMVADIGIELEGMRLATYRAAARAEQGKDIGREGAIARRLTGEYGMRIGTDGVQLLGGHGFVKDHPVERWYRDLRAVGLMEGAVLV
ncbi:MAG: acyl-CoA dehydrogenase family protein [Nocardioidaceae bacterium]